MPDFFEFWKTAKSEPLGKKIELWETLFERQHREFYRNVIYADLTEEELGQSKARVLNKFLNSLTDEHVWDMKKREKEFKELIPQVSADLQKLLPHDGQISTHYIVPFLFFFPTLDTGPLTVSPYKEEIVAAFGLEAIKKQDTLDSIKTVILHTWVHILQYRNISPILWRKYKDNVNLYTLIEGEGPLLFAFKEGLAVFVSWKAYPDIFPYGPAEKYIPRYEKNFVHYAREFLKDMKDFSLEVYHKYFRNESDGPEIPGKFGYWLGYKVVKSLRENHSLEDMIQWSPARIVQTTWEEIKRMSKDQ
ncbi:MAG: hypothetical protein PVI11_04415 [Candidatus Aminicenantes bacterium]|jgi:hypothetical protein